MTGTPRRREEWHGPIQFAPRRIREQTFALVDDVERVDGGGIQSTARRPILDPDLVVELERDVFDALHNSGQQRFGVGPSSDPEPSRWLRKSLALGIGGVALAAVLWTAWPAIEEAALLVTSSGLTAPAVETKPALTLTQQQGHSDESLPLGIAATSLVPEASVRLTGFPKGTRIAPGGGSETEGWLMMASDLPVATVTPPRGYSGTMQITAEMRDKTQHMLARGTVQPTWIASPPAVAPPTQDRTASAPPAKEARQIAPDDLAALIRRGEDVLKTGDASAARLLLERAAEAGSARAAFLIGTSYEMASPGSRAADTETARNWFRRSADLGSVEAQQRLGASASAAPR
jgi:hypothetical protein